jgi:hypothetical protein
MSFVTNAPEGGRNMNRHQRRAAAATGRRAKQNAVYNDYIKHLPEVAIDAPMEHGRVHHVCFFHDDWCQIYVTGNAADCNCNPAVARHVEPVWS